jgi:MFS family permease
MTSANRATSLGEFVTLMATLTALAAMSIDMVLPALPSIGTSLGVERANDNQLIVSLLFLGFGLGQLFYGPLSDAVGRKPAAFAGLTLFSAGCVLALTSSPCQDGGPSSVCIWRRDSSPRSGSPCARKRRCHANGAIR